MYKGGDYMQQAKSWHAHYPKEIPPSLEYEEKSLQSYLMDSASRYPEKKALYFMGKELTYEETFTQAKQFANYLQTLGVKKGDRVAIMLPNCPQAVISYYGILMAGGVVVQTNPLYTERELEYQVKDSEAKIIICLDILVPRVSNVQEKTNLEHKIVTAIKDYLPFPKNLVYPFIQKREYNMVVKVEESEDTHVWENVIRLSKPEYTEVEVNPKEDLALLQYTGGTTGHPKGVMLTHYNLTTNLQMCEAWLYKTKPSEEIILAVLPFFHVYGMTTVMNFGIKQASKLILMPKFDALSVLKIIDKQKPTVFPGAPTIYIGLINHPDIHKYDLSSIKACLSGSAPLPLEVQQQFEKLSGGRLVEGYGLTETAPVTHANPIWENRINGSIGLPWPDTDAKVVKAGTDEEAEIGEVGEIAVRGPQVMSGYWKNEEETNEVLRDGWFYTGDMGYMDENGYFYIVDRKKDMIIAGGYNIYPREVEEVLYEHPKVQEVAVVGIPDPYRGETVKAFVVVKEGKEVTEEELNKFCREHMAAFKVPRKYEFRDELPKTVIGKILRRQLIEEEIKQQEQSEPV
jgi:long-chain acyl-CoA synthetase